MQLESVNVQPSVVFSETMKVPAVGSVMTDVEPIPPLVVIEKPSVPVTPKRKVASPPIVFLTIVSVGRKGAQSASARSIPPFYVSAASLSLSMPSVQSASVFSLS